MAHPTDRKWVVTLVGNGISRVSPPTTGVITHLLSEMNHPHLWDPKIMQDPLRVILCHLHAIEWRPPQELWFYIWEPTGALKTSQVCHPFGLRLRQQHAIAEPVAVTVCISATFCSSPIRAVVRCHATENDINHQSMSNRLVACENARV